MITRALFLSLAWLVLSWVGVLVAGRRLNRPQLGAGRLFVSLSWLLSILMVGDAWAILTFGVAWEIALLSGFALLVGLFVILWRRDWNALGQTAWAMTLVAVVFFLVYSFTLAAFTPLSAAGYVLAMLLFFVELAGLLLALPQVFLGLDALTRVRTRRRSQRFEAPPGYAPHVTLLLAVQDEPPEIVEATLRTLSGLDYPHYETLVVDTAPGEKNWTRLQQWQREPGSKFRALHLEKWPGLGGHALNFALTQTDPQTEIVGIVKPGDRLDPSFLPELVPAFSNPETVFVQSAIDERLAGAGERVRPPALAARRWEQVFMPARDELNAAVFSGRLALARKSALEAAGGWDDWSLTPHADLGLRMLKQGGQAFFVDRSYGQSVLPADAAWHRSETFRRAVGDIQLLRQHGAALLPWARWLDPRNRLTLAQRLAYLSGSLQPLTAIFSLIFAAFLLLGLALSLLPEQPAARAFAGPLLVTPLVYLVLAAWRHLWVLHAHAGGGRGAAFAGLFEELRRLPATASAAIQGLTQPAGVLVRSPSGGAAAGMPAGEAAAAGGSRLIRSATHWSVGLVTLALLAGVSLAVLPGPNETPVYANYQPQPIPAEELVGRSTALPPTPGETVPAPAGMGLPATVAVSPMITPTVAMTPTLTFTPTITPTLRPPATAIPTIRPPTDDEELPPATDPPATDPPAATNPPPSEPPPTEPPPSEPPPTEPPPTEPPPTEPPPTEPPQPTEPPPPPPEPTEPPPEPTDPPAEPTDPPVEPTDPPDEPTEPPPPPPELLQPLLNWLSP